MNAEKYWVGSMTDEYKKQGGIWVIGDNPYDSNPNYPGKNDGSLIVKSWVANKDKYSGSYAPKSRMNQNLWEYVRVFTGSLDCTFYYEDEIRSTLQYPDDGIDIPPSIKRSWQLPENCNTATGITICRKIKKLLPIKNGWGTDYKYYSWDAGSNESLKRIFEPLPNLNL